MKEIKSEHLGFMFGSLTAFGHAVWSLLVMLGFAQELMDWIFWLHFLNNPYRIGQFEFTRAIMLVTFTFAMGYLVGWIVAYLWNMLHSAPKTTRKK